MKAKILIVDDIPEEARTVSEVVEALGDFEISFARGRREALLELSRDAFDAVILDLILGGLNEGKMLLHSMKRRLDRTPGTIVISKIGNHPVAQELWGTFDFIVGIINKTDLEELPGNLDRALRSACAYSNQGYNEEKESSDATGRTHSSPKKAVARDVGLRIGIATFIFFMLVAVVSIFGLTIPCEGRFPAVAVLALGVGMAMGFLGGSAKAEGRLPLPGDVGSPLLVGVTGGLAALVITLWLGWFFYVRSCAG
jgi:CheY-like chemotaxis protein